MVGYGRDHIAQIITFLLWNADLKRLFNLEKERLSHFSFTLTCPAEPHRKQISDAGAPSSVVTTT